MSQGIVAPIYYKELGSKEGTSPAFSADTKMSNGRRSWLIQSQYIQLAMAQLVGYSYLDGNKKLQRWLPQEDPQIKGLFATTVQETRNIGWRAKAQQEFGSLNVFALSCLDIDFEPRPYPILGEDDILDSTTGLANEFLRFVEIETQPEGEYLKLPAVTGTFRWSEGNLGHVGGVGAADPQSGKGSIIPDQPGIIVSRPNYIFKWEDIPDDGMASATNQLLDTVGTTNKKDFGDPNSTKGRFFFEAGTLLMIGGGWKRTFMWTPSGVKTAWHIEMMVKYNDNGWTRLYNFKDRVPDWYQVVIQPDAGAAVTAFAEGSIPDGKCIYNETDYAKCFRTDL